MDLPEPSVVGGTLSVAGGLALLLKLWLKSLEARQTDRDNTTQAQIAALKEDGKARDIETKSQLTVVINELKTTGKVMNAFDRRLALMEREVERLDRTPSGRFRVRSEEGEG